ncbi:MAG: carboxypeptidase regulatory-like domain-containing protein [Candidatus Thermoplasmatota archaeon]|nr:carboxypeptidase regulatory-like domain-containing protein [Candidatus Thermoplasmatota archaeon]
MKRKWVSLSACILLIGISYVSVTGNQAYDPIRAESPTSETLCHSLLKVHDAPQVASIFIKEGFDVFVDTITDDSFELVVKPGVFKKLQTQGYHLELLSQGRPFRGIQAEQMIMEPLLPAGYIDYPAMVDVLYSYESQYPSICKVYDLTTWYGLSPTYEGRHLYAIKISDNVATDEDEPNFLMVGAHHAREVVTPVICNHSIQQFTTQYGIDPDVTAAVDNYEIWISPIWNPDGYVYMFNYDNYWRKNRAPPDGVDLNRNYPLGWDSAGGGSTNPYDETYKGPSPASEAETQTMMVFGNDRHFSKIIDYHSYGREVLYAYVYLSHPFTSFLQSEAIRLSNAVGYSGSIRLASANGENYQWHLAYNGSYANLIETHTSFQPTYASALSEAALVWPGTLWELQREISISGHVTDSATGAPLVATITLEGVTFTNGEHYMSEPRFGRYHLFLPPGTYTVNFSAPGYESQNHQVTVTLTSTEILEVPLTRPNSPPCAPIIDGTTTGFTGKLYEYCFSTNDPDNNDVEYFVDWGDGSNSSWTGPFESGQEVTVVRYWSTAGTFHVKVKARDPLHEESSWSSPLDVNIFTLTRSTMFGLIREKNETEDYISCNAKFLVILPSTLRLYRSDESIMISKSAMVGFVGERFVFGKFNAVVLT